MNGRGEQMDDLIKRQDAINAYCEHECGIKGMTRENCGATDCGTIFDDIPSAQQWIPCSERLPEGGREILVTEKGGFIRHCEYANYGDFQEFQTVEEGLTVHDVIAWMPLPEPYKGEES